MAKKVRKPRSSSPRTYSQAGPMPNQNVVPSPVAPAMPVVSAAPVAKAGQTVDLAAEYGYVGKELRRLGLTAAALIVAEIVLNLVLRQIL